MATFLVYWTNDGYKNHSTHVLHIYYVPGMVQVL